MTVRLPGRSIRRPGLAALGSFLAILAGASCTAPGVKTSDPASARSPAEICGCAADMQGCLCAHCLGMPEACPCHDEEGNLKPEACREAPSAP